MISNATTYYCDICGEEITVENQISHTAQTIVLNYPQSWGFEVSPDGQSSVVLCPKCKSKKVTWKMVAQVEEDKREHTI